jgi:NDP-sugar pyrophosphorylase family protein
MKKKILIIGDSNSLPRYDDNNFLRLEDIYVYKIKNFFRYKNFDIEQVSWGGITTSQLINFAIKKNYKVNACPIHENWVDIGTYENLNKLL